MATKKKKKEKTTTQTKKPKKKADPEEIKLDPEVEAFAKWFADWWLRRGLRLTTEAEKADPDFKKRKRSKRHEDRLPFYWDEETERFVLERDSDAED